MGDDFSVNGFLLVDKPEGLTSHQVVARVKRSLGIRRVGHGGTLDPMATGLLVVGVGRATRLLGHIADKTKQYTACIRLGQATTTDDAEGELTGAPVDATVLQPEQVHAAMAGYVGAIQQVPSSVSAIKVNGRRAYDLVRCGETVELKSREVTVTAFDLLSRTDDSPWADLWVLVDCSSGTYVRALARDLGKDLGVGGHLTALRRTRIGQMSVENAVSLDDIGPDSVIPMGEMAHHIAPSIHVDETQVRDIAVGRPINVEITTGMASIFYGAQMLALYEPDPHDPGRAVPIAVFIDPTDRSLQTARHEKTGKLG